MTKAQKLILIILLIDMVLLTICLIVLFQPAWEDPLPMPEPTEVPVVHIKITAPPATPAPTTLPVVEIRIPAPDEIPEPMASSTASVTPSNVMPTPEGTPAYVHMPTSAPMNTPVPTVPKGMAFTLSILGKMIPVANNVEEDTLEKSPGWLPTSAKPGKEGICVVYGHRNRNHLLILKEIEKNDEIDVIMSDGKIYTYIVDKAEILDTDEAMRIPAIEGKHMILMTCYPFYYTGHAPQKFVVTCTLKGGGNT